MVMLTLPGAIRLPPPSKLSAFTIDRAGLGEDGSESDEWHGVDRTGVDDGSIGFGLGQAQLRQFELDLLDFGVIGADGGRVARVGDHQVLQIRQLGGQVVDEVLRVLGERDRAAHRVIGRVCQDVLLDRERLDVVDAELDRAIDGDSGRGVHDAGAGMNVRGNAVAAQQAGHAARHGREPVLAGAERVRDRVAVLFGHEVGVAGCQQHRPGTDVDGIGLVDLAFRDEVEGRDGRGVQLVRARSRGQIVEIAAHIAAGDQVQVALRLNKGAGSDVDGVVLADGCFTVDRARRSQAVGVDRGRHREVAVVRVSRLTSPTV